MLERLTAASLLQTAIDKLRAFASKLAKKESRSFASKTIASMRSFLNLDDRMDEGVHNAVAVIQRQRLLIQKLQNGTPADQKLAEAANQAVGAYNEWCKKKQNSTRHKVKYFFNKEGDSSLLSKIELPQSWIVRRHFPAKNPPLATKYAFSSSTPSLLNPQITELFQMKALALLEHYNIASNVQARNQVKKTPIITLKEEGNSRYILQQIFSIFPGQTITISGAAVLNGNSITNHQLLPETFSIFLESVQTGFPHPLQRTGWALGHSLIPERPYRLDLLKNLSEFFNKKNFLITALQPDGEWTIATKRLLKLKKTLFIKHREELLTLHRKFSHILLQAALEGSSVGSIDESISREQKEILNLFYDDLQTKPHALEELAQVHQTLRDYYFTKPHEKLLEGIFNEKNNGFSDYTPSMRYEAIKTLLNESLLEIHQEVGNLKQRSSNSTDQLKWQYIECLGWHLGEAGNLIILQYLSEDFIFSPAILTPFANKLQVAAYQQVSDFFYELTLQTENIDHVYKLIKDELNTDIKLFAINDSQKKNNNDDDLNIALANYYRARFVEQIQ